MSARSQIWARSRVQYGTRQGRRGDERVERPVKIVARLWRRSQSPGYNRLGVRGIIKGPSSLQQFRLTVCVANVTRGLPTQTKGIWALVEPLSNAKT